MAEIQIIRAAFREIQKLRFDDLQKLYDVFLDLKNGTSSQTKKLRGYDELWRTRFGDWRVIWQQHSTNLILVIKVARRGDIYDNLFEKRDYSNSRALAELQEPSGVPSTEHPTYEWKQPKREDWYKYVFNGYRYSPILTPTQWQIFNRPIQSFHDRYSPRQWLVQSAPGTGKTVCATLLACEMSKNDIDVALIVPEALKSDLSEYSEVKKAKQRDNFSIGTLREWLARLSPDIYANSASPEEELETLRKASQLAINKARSCPHPEEIESVDVLLYQAFVLDTKNQNRQKNAIYGIYQERIEQLEEIDKKFWDQALPKPYCRLYITEELKQNPCPPLSTHPASLLIIDEAQDYLLAELQAILSLCQSWNAQGHLIYLWLLGDLNQRIQPTDFDWGQLRASSENQDLPELEISRNYRNSGQVLAFANQFIEELGKQCASRLRVSHPLAVTKPENAFEVGEPVRLLICRSNTEAEAFLKILDQPSEEVENSRFLIYSLANAVKVVSPSSRTDTYENLVVLTAKQAKGREFESCVAFRLFAGTGELTVEDCFQWYTMLTRARSRLLVVTTQEEIERVGSIYFEQCERVKEVERVTTWIKAVASDIDLQQIPDDVEERLLKGCQRAHLYEDTYEALLQAGVDSEKWEEDAIAHLKQSPLEKREAELREINDPRLRCLLLRSMHRSWDAVLELEKIRPSQPAEYERLIGAIAKDLENKNLLLEAARVRTRIGNTYPSEYPFPEIDQSGSLVALLCQAFIDKIESVKNS